MTIHLAKGLEFPFVYIVGLENLFPSAMNLNSRTELEEEEDLFYVALLELRKRYIFHMYYQVSMGQACRFRKKQIY